MFVKFKTKTAVAYNMDYTQTFIMCSPLHTIKRGVRHRFEAGDLLPSWARTNNLAAALHQVINSELIQVSQTAGEKSCKHVASV